MKKKQKQRRNKHVINLLKHTLRDQYTTTVRWTFLPKLLLTNIIVTFIFCMFLKINANLRHVCDNSNILTLSSLFFGNVSSIVDPSVCVIIYYRHRLSHSHAKTNEMKKKYYLLLKLWA